MADCRSGRQVLVPDRLADVHPLPVEQVVGHLPAPQPQRHDLGPLPARRGRARAPASGRSPASPARLRPRSSTGAAGRGHSRGWRGPITSRRTRAARRPRGPCRASGRWSRRRSGAAPGGGRRRRRAAARRAPRRQDRAAGARHTCAPPRAPARATGAAAPAPAHRRARRQDRRPGEQHQQARRTPNRHGPHRPLASPSSPGRRMPIAAPDRPGTAASPTLLRRPIRLDALSIGMLQAPQVPRLQPGRADASGDAGRRPQ